MELTKEQLRALLERWVDLYGGSTSEDKFSQAEMTALDRDTDLALRGLGGTTQEPVAWVSFGPLEVVREKGSAYAELHRQRTKPTQIALYAAPAGTVAVPREPTIPVISEIAAERQRQIEKEGWDNDHDDEHTDGALALAGACYAANAADSIRGRHEGIPRHQQMGWPWGYEWWKPKDPRRDLVRAAALIVAEIERMDRNQPREAATYTFPNGAAPAAPEAGSEEGTR